VTATLFRVIVEPTIFGSAPKRLRQSLSLNSATLAGAALAAGLVDELHLFLNPVVVGAGTRALPDGVRLDLELLAEHRFGNGVVHLHHRVRR